MTNAEREARKLKDPLCVGFNDEAGVYCAICEWSALSRSIEVMEAKLNGHLLAVHGFRAFWRTEEGTGREIRIP